MILQISCKCENVISLIEIEVSLMFPSAQKRKKLFFLNSCIEIENL